MLSMTNLNDSPATGGPLRADDFAGHKRAVLLRCTADACQQQGRMPCPCPQACLAADDGQQRPDEGAGVVVWGAVCLLAAFAAAVLAALLP